MPDKPKLLAGDLINLLAVKHQNDVFVPECKDGPTLSGAHRHRRLDAWVMLKSWSNPLTIGYEIKVSRSDFLSDDKWHTYLPLCNELYFVCPTGLIAPAELPAEVGLLYASSTGTRLFTKKRAPRREVQIPENLWRYVLMCRANITRERLEEQSNREYWQDWMEGVKSDRVLGRSVSKKLNKVLNDKVLAVEQENKRVNLVNESLLMLRDWLKEVGIESSGRYRFFDTQAKIQRLMDGIPQGLDDSVNAVIEKLGVLKENLRKLSD